MKHPFQSFDEVTYLQLNPDVLEAIKGGSISCGLEHYIYHGFREHRPGVAPELYNALKGPMEDFLRSVPPEYIPPDHLRQRVHGNVDLTAFEIIGRMVSFNIYSSINSIIELGEQHRVLDFGCGCGRIIRYFRKLYAQTRLYGTDIDEEAIVWCQHHLSQIGAFIANKDSPPLPFADDMFEFVYSISIFTHLPEDMELAWLEELRRVTRRGGYLLLTTHSEELLQDSSEENKEQLRENGFYYSVGNKTEGLPEFYQTSFHTEDYIHRHWSKVFEIEKVIKKGIANRQDLILCRKPN